MVFFNNISKYETINIKEHIENIKEQINTGMKLNSDNNYNAEDRRIKNLEPPTSNKDAIHKS